MSASGSGSNVSGGMNTGSNGNGGDSGSTNANASTSNMGGTTATGGQIPWAFTDCPTDTLILLISHMLNLLIQHNDQVVLTPDALTRFHSRAAPGISVLEYLRRIVKYTNMEKIPLLSLLAYIDITCQHLPTFTLSSLTVHRFLIAGVCAGSKAQCDVFCTNAHYAKVGGIKVQELNALEREFLKVTQWNLCCNADLLQRYYTSLIRSHGGYTQAPEPAIRPFKSFPRSLSKPREEVDEEMKESDERGEGIEEEEESEVAEEEEGAEEQDGEEEVSPRSSRRRSLDVSGMVVETTGETASIPIPGNNTSRKAPTRRRSSRLLASSQQEEEMEVDGSQVSPATSSIPSSSRSSIRGGSRGGRGRALSLSYSDARISEPQVNKATANGSPFQPTRSSASTSPINHLAPRASSSQNSEGSQASSSSREGASHEGGQDEHHHHGHHVPGAHLLKSFGGIFNRRKSSHTDRPAVPPPSSSHEHSSSTKSHANGHPVILSQPIRHGTQSSHNDLPPPPVPSHRQRPVSQPPLPPHSTIGTPSTVPPGLVKPLSRDSSIARSPRSLKSPGMAKPVTPRVRMREEISDTDLHAIPSLCIQVSTDDGNRRARME